MLLAVNIGNSSIRFGIFEKDQCINSWIINSKADRTEDEFYALFKGYYVQYAIEEKELNQIVVGSVVPKHTEPVCTALKKIHGFDPFLVTRETPSSIKHDSNQLGTDLYANAVGAHTLFKKKSIIIDFGTALTLIGIDYDGTMLGVVIAPGVNTALQSLVGNTAQLPDIELTAPKKVLGLETVACMQSGIVYGYLSMIEGLIDRIKEEIGKDTYVIATGGLCHIFESLTHKIDYTDKLHTIKGLKVLYELNH
ncbi:MAG: type III pantothenate kinase [Flavobacteriales bacterium]